MDGNRRLFCRNRGTRAGRAFTLAFALGTALAMCSSSLAYAEGLVGVGESSSGSVAAVATTGSASSSGGVAVSGTGSASSGAVAIAGNQATGGVVGVGGTGTGNGGQIGVSVLGYGSGGTVGASAAGNSYGGTLAVSGIGETAAASPYEVSAYGVGYPEPVETTGSMIKAVKGLLDEMGEFCAGVAWVDLRQTPPTIEPTAVGSTCLFSQGVQSYDGQECEACTGWNGVKWRNRGQKRDVAVFFNKNTANEYIDRQNNHGALLRTRKRWRDCAYDDELAELKWNLRTEASYAMGTNELVSPWVTGENQSFLATSGHNWSEGGSSWSVHTVTDICLHFNHK